MIGTTTNPSAAVEVGEAFGAASAESRARLDRAHKREKQGQAATREDTFTDDLVDEMEGTIQERLLRTAVDLSEKGKVRIEFEATKAPQGEETSFGLDLGVRVIIESPGYSIEKAILVQCKRMYGTDAKGTFPKLKKDGEKQARDMLSVTPASFFFLFNRGSQQDLWKLMRPAGFESWPLLWLRPDLAPLHHYFDPGIAVVPATRILALSHSSSPFPTGAKDVLAGATPLGQFISELFAPCIVGDPRRPIIQLATPPAQRGSAGGLDANVPSLAGLNSKRYHRLKITKLSG